jgi:hemoglobin
MKKDISSRDDLTHLMNAFYKRLLSDPSISYLFTDVAKISILEHIPVLVDFWDMVLFNSDTYSKNVMQIHVDIHKRSPLFKEHFITWLNYFNQSVDDLFEGDKATLAKQRAASIATLMQIKMVK